MFLNQINNQISQPIIMQELYEQNIHFYTELENDVEKIFQEFQQESQRKSINKEKYQEYIQFLMMAHQKINQEQKKVDAIELNQIKKKGIKKTIKKNYYKK
ncbi:unnamed protein product [Paramecium sonneborni]|uniref:Uncharacterized protein n=1 Tax=Paramecium sonneborni TaxID=65129 RepID=A0A8S1MAW1_9CILI|nr:unnamed protein product [Paramecium sonneborni]